jgi:hypothetical protein
MVVIIPGLTSDSDDAVNLQDTRPRPSYVLFQSQCNVRINSFQSCYVEIIQPQFHIWVKCVHGLCNV